MIFKNMLGKVLQGLSNFSPVKNLIKYIIDRSLNELLSDQISLEDFKNGELFLTKLSLNLQKINRDYLLSSPYILHRGEVRRLKITLPSWSQLSTKSIEITAEGLHIDLKPNKQFVDNFKEAMREQHADITQPQEPGGIDNPMDFFRQLVKQIILNMKIRVENSVVRLFINEPTKEVTAKPQYYLMFRLPLLAIGKNEDLVVGKSEEVEEIKFDFVIPQMSLHLLKENADFPEYLNEKASMEDFPFTYPPVSHPSTILLIGQGRDLNNVDKQRSTKLTITLTTFFKKQRKTVSIQGKINNFQATIDPIQLKIISRFFAQLMQFQKILKSVMAEMGLNPQAPNLNLSRRDSKGKSGNYDLFSSIMISIAEPSKPAPSAEIGIYSNMMQSPEMLKAANEFNEKAVLQLRSSGDFEEGWKNISFKQELIMRFQLKLLQANLLKYVSASAYERKWSAEEGYERVNESLGCSHYRLVTLGVQYTFSSSKNQHEVKVRVVKLQDARLKNSLSFHQSVSEEFYDLDSSTFENTNINQDYFTRQPELFPFRLYKEQHYCLEELFQLSEGQEKQFQGDRVKTYAFMPAGGQCGQGAGLSVNFNGHSKALIVVIKDVAVMVNFEIWKDVLNMVYPVFLYRKLYERMNLQTPDIHLQEHSLPKNFNMFESQYPMAGRLLEEAESRQQKLQVRVKVGLVYCFYRETAGLKTKQTLFEEVEKKILDSDNFSKQCFCNLNEKGIYAEIRGLEWQQMEGEFNLSLAEVKAGLLAVVDSKTEQDVKPILIAQSLRVQQVKEQRRQGKLTEAILKNRTYLPKVRFVVQLPALISFIDMTKKVVAVVDSLQHFKKTLASKLLIIEQEIGNRSKVGKDKAQKERVMEVFVGEVELKMLLISTYLRGVFFRKKGGEQELKLCSIAAGLAKKQDVRIGQFRNQLITGQYPLTQSYAGIRDTNLILEIGRGCKQKQWGTMANEVKGKRRVERKLQFFDGLEKETMNLWVIIKEKTESGHEKKGSREFKFDKARKNSVIEQEKKVKDITILPLEVFIHAGNLAFLLLHKKEIEDIFNEVGLVLKEIQEESRDIMERRGSIQSENEVTTEISLTLNDLKVNIDIKPDYSYNPNTALRILSNTRMFLNLSLQKLKIIANPDSKQAEVALSLSLGCHFLHYLDRDIETNPLLLDVAALGGLGFRKIAQMNDLAVRALLNGKANVNELQCSIDSAKAELCLSTIPYLRLFLDHFTQHSLLGNYGSDEDSHFIVLDNEPNQDIPEDITEKLQEYQRLLDEKKRVFSEFSTRPFQISDAEGPRLIIKKFAVNVVRVKLMGGNEFKFVECNSENESRACLRNRSENPDLLNFLSLTVENIRTRAMKGEKELQVLLELDRLQLQLSFKRREGLLWGAQKDYTTHLLKINSPLKILVQLNKEYSKFKLNALQMTASFTDQVFSLAQQFQIAASACEKSAWKRHYKLEKAEPGRKMLLAILPEGRITASAQFKRTKLLNERVLRLQDLLIHEQSSNAQRISKLFNDWAMSIFTSNLGTLVSGALFEVLSTCIGLLLGAVRQILSLFFPGLKE